ncbi:unnamed protein product [Bursaphelenchus okinawaensis]|uniref:Uncharacterized protein n=1 Tax=Bursaphelenchus okinawaensis TaxID=465554 RepID=A0A811KPI4_9BILA|nr:unnamed protein product [Bursaphelenchus okinawaensis]CAG9106909.1 unnamed protein product [Bursaphelenchus okinawaensis]
MFYILVLISIFVYRYEGAEFVKRYRRQLIPIEHVQVHSLRSNVTVLEDTVETRSLDSILEFNKPPYNISYFSRYSLSSIDSKASFLRINSSYSDIALGLHSVRVRCLASKTSLDLRMNPNQIDQSEMRTIFDSDVNFAISNLNFNLAVFNGSHANLRTRTGTNEKDKIFRFGYENSTEEFRVNSVDNNDVVDVVLQGNLIHLTYGEIIIQIDRNYRRLILISSSHRIEFHTIGATFQASINDQSLQFDYLTDRIRVIVQNNSPNVTVIVSTPSKSDLDRTTGVDINLNDRPNKNIDHLQLIAQTLQLQLVGAQNGPAIYANANESVLSLSTNKSEVRLSASNQLVQITGQAPILVTTTENVAIVITGRGNGTLSPPHTIQPQIDYGEYKIQNLTNITATQDNANWLTSKLNLNNLVNQAISDVQDFPPVLGESFRSATNNNLNFVDGENSFPFDDNKSWSSVNSDNLNSDALFPTDATKDTFSLQPFEGMENINSDNDDSLFNENGKKITSESSWNSKFSQNSGQTSNSNQNTNSNQNSAQNSNLNNFGPLWSSDGVAWVTIAPGRQGQPEFVSGEEPKSSSTSSWTGGINTVDGQTTGGGTWNTSGGSHENTSQNQGGTTINANGDRPFGEGFGVDSEENSQNSTNNASESQNSNGNTTSASQGATNTSLENGQNGAAGTNQSENATQNENTSENGQNWSVSTSTHPNITAANRTISSSTSSTNTNQQKTSNVNGWNNWNWSNFGNQQNSGGQSQWSVNQGGNAAQNNNTYSNNNNRVQGSISWLTPPGSVNTSNGVSDESDLPETEGDESVATTKSSSGNINESASLTTPSEASENSPESSTTLSDVLTTTESSDSSNSPTTISADISTTTSSAATTETTPNQTDSEINDVTSSTQPNSTSNPSLPGQQNEDNDLFPTPPSIAKTISETGFPIPPMPGVDDGNNRNQNQDNAGQNERNGNNSGRENETIAESEVEDGEDLKQGNGTNIDEDRIEEVEKTNDNGDVSQMAKEQTYDRSDDTFAIAHFGEITTQRPNIMATIVNITIVSPTTPMPALF